MTGFVLDIIKGTIMWLLNCYWTIGWFNYERRTSAKRLIKNPQKIGSWNFYNIGSTTISALKKSDIIRSIDYGNVSNKRVDAIITKKKRSYCYCGI